MFMPSAASAIGLETGTQFRPGDSAISGIELRVALLAKRDAERRGWDVRLSRFPMLRRLIELVTGIGGVQRLADDRLEKLRLFICMKRRSDARAETLAAELIAMGFSPLALRRLEAVATR